MRKLIEYDHDDAIDAGAQLKESGDGTLVKYGNGPFSRALVEAGLLDELHLSISPLRPRLNCKVTVGARA
jgi:hypothetical protein